MDCILTSIYRGGEEQKKRDEDRDRPAGADRSAAATVVSGLLSPALLLLDDDGLARLLHYCALLRHPHVQELAGFATRGNRHPYPLAVRLYVEN